MNFIFSSSQNSLGTQDLGQFFYRPIKDSQGSIVLTTINCVKDPKSVNTTALKWLPISKIQKRLSPAPDNPASSELLLSNISVSRSSLIMILPVSKTKRYYF